MHRHVALVGPTASGKSTLALALAQHDPRFEIVSVDSMQVYRGMDIGTAKPSPAEQALVPHHLIDVVDPSDDFTLKQFQEAAKAAITAIESRGKRALLVGGTGLYLQAVTDGLTLPGQYPEVRDQLDAEPDARALYDRLVVVDAVAASRIEPDNRRRIIRALEVTLGSGRAFSSFGPGIGAYPDVPFSFVALRMDSAVNAERIERRVDAMFASGLVEEVRSLRDRFTLNRTALQAIGYKEVIDAMPEGGEVAADAVIDEVKRRTRSFARRQRVWFRRDPRMHVVDVTEDTMAAFSELQAVACAAEWSVS